MIHDSKTVIYCSPSPLKQMDDKNRVNKARFSIIIVFSILAAMMFAAPYSLPPSSVKDLSGKVGVLDNQKVIEKMNPFAQVIYTIGDWNCHQMASRSLFLNGNQMPFCARDTGILLGAIIGMIFAIAFDPKFRWIYIVLGLVPLALDGGLQLLTPYESTNEIRLLTGAIAGIAASLLLSHVAWTSLSISGENKKK